MNQLPLDLDRAREQGDANALRAGVRAERASPGFIDAASDFILAQLVRFGPLAGEDLVDRAKSAGLAPPDDRAFGIVFRRLSVRGLIVFDSFTTRRKGHGTAGGRIWRAALG